MSVGRATYTYEDPAGVEHNFEAWFTFRHADEELDEIELNGEPVTYDELEAMFGANTANMIVAKLKEIAIERAD